MQDDIECVSKSECRQIYISQQIVHQVGCTQRGSNIYSHQPYRQVIQSRYIPSNSSSYQNIQHAQDSNHYILGPVYHVGNRVVYPGNLVVAYSPFEGIYIVLDGSIEVTVGDYLIQLLVV